MCDQHTRHRPIVGEVLLQLAACFEAELVDATHDEEAVRILVGENLQARGQGLHLLVGALLHRRAVDGAALRRRLAGPIAAEHGGLPSTAQSASGGGGDVLLRVAEGAEHEVRDVLPGDLTTSCPADLGIAGILAQIFGTSYNSSRSSHDGGGAQIVEMLEQDLLLVEDLQSHVLGIHELIRSHPSESVRMEAIPRFELVHVVEGAVQDAQCLLQTLGIQEGSGRHDSIDPLALCRALSVLEACPQGCSRCRCLVAARGVGVLLGGCRVGDLSGHNHDVRHCLSEARRRGGL
mmetsp:Transcript_66278/g.187266  ORF Transcript_66278/g.187266 Transcript_66278/m.187266 type:complete len:292 (+) Transcript_66278:642-1517(+)